MSTRPLAYLPSVSLAQGRSENGDDGSVLGKVQLFFDGDRRLQIKYTERRASEDATMRVWQQCVEVPSLADGSKYVERSMSGHQQVVSRATQCVT